MTIFPNLVSIDDINNTNKLPLFEEWAYDFEKNEFKVRNGTYYKVYANEALKIWIYKALKTARYRYQAYSFEFGTELESLVGLSTNKDVIESEAKRYITETLLCNPYILAVTDFKFDSKGSIEDVEFRVKTIYGETENRIGFIYG
jgi:phage protein|nr:MAG TPA: Protein of unknown function (DUF2634) [Caudoviricetes sp.]